MAKTHEFTESWLRGYIRYYSENTSIHGFRFLGLKNISRGERALWFIIVNAALFYSYSLIVSNARHFIANPTVVTLKKDFRNWENPFPAVTACFVNKVDPEKAQKFILRKWGVSIQDEKYEYYMEFIKTLADLTYITYPKLMRFQNDSILNNVDMVELVTEVHPNLTGTLVTFQTKIKVDWKFVLTEKGLCFSINSDFADLLSPSYSGPDSLELGNKKENLKCHYLNGLCYARYDSDPKMPIEYHVHSHLEIIHFSSETPIKVGVSEEVEINYRLTETFSSPAIRYLTPDQRKCRFYDEPLIKNVPVYSTGICFVDCRSRWGVKMCGCSPFYHKFLGAKMCDVQGLICLWTKFNVFFQTFNCKCFQSCNLMVYLKQVPRVTRWDAGYFDQRITFRWGLMPPTTKYHRKIIFGLQDLIVSLGGVLSLFLGMSFISFQESFYLTVKYFRLYLQRKLTKKGNRNKKAQKNNKALKMSN